MDKELLRTFIELQLYGVCDSSLEPGRRGGAGPCGMRAFLFGEQCVMLPVHMAETASPFHLEREGAGLRIVRDGRKIMETRLVPRPSFYDLSTATGVPYKSIALLHGRDCLASTVLQQCSRYANPASRCRFCALGESLKAGSTILRKTPEQLAEVAEAARQSAGISHVTLTSGTTADRDRGILYLGECAHAVHTRTGLPVQIQFEPPCDRAVFTELKRLGVANVAMHVESLDENVRRRMTPGKAEIPLKTYFRAFEDALAVFGRNRVGSYVILGMGEDQRRTLEGCRELVRMGVYPSLVPLRPLPGTAMAGAPLPDADYLFEMYTKIGEIMREEHISSARCGGGCARCRACSLLQFTERAEAAPVPALPLVTYADEGMASANLLVACTEEDLAACRAVRQAVFVEEQGLFSEDDQDVHDRDAVHILARVNGEAAGVVRCYPAHGYIWYGGRLAVLRKFRSRLGAMLVNRAVELMESRPDVRRFFALVQIQNIRFFKRLHWVSRGRPFIYNGCRHQLMERPLREQSKPSTAAMPPEQGLRCSA